MAHPHDDPRGRGRMMLGCIGIIGILLLFPWHVPPAFAQDRLGSSGEAAFEGEEAGPEGAFRAVVQHVQQDRKHRYGHFYVDPRPMSLAAGPRPPRESDLLAEGDEVERRMGVLESLGIERGEVFSRPEGCPAFEPLVHPEGCPDERTYTLALDRAAQLDSDRWRVRMLLFILTPRGFSAETSDVYLSVEDGRWRVYKVKLRAVWG